ncbi:hypothetical protein AB0D08_35890 [Kitasatospora sp. NPDC048540]|uniref:hypothetical protein n=1 Tax=Kitasatospora sp. NPDC048540 TaxID=3155634 RepID=UPI0033E5D346
MPVAAVGTVFAAGRLRARLGEVVRRPVPRVVKPLAVSSGLLAVAAALSFAGAWSAFSPGLYPDKTCMALTGYREFPDSSGSLPLSTVCHGVETVPGWVNPVLGSLAGGALATGAAAAAGYAGSWSGRRATRTA